MAFRRNLRRKLRKRFTLGGVRSTALRMLPSVAASLATRNPMPLLTQLGSECKRFVQNISSDGTLGGLPLSVTATTPYQQTLTLIPRNIASTAIQFDNRFTRKVYIKGVWMNLQVESQIANGYQTMRVIIFRADNAFENLSNIANFYAPAGATRGIRILHDKYHRLSGKNDGNGLAAKSITRFIKVNRKLSFTGNQIDGSDTDNGTLKIVILCNDPTGIEVVGACTLSYRELN